MISCWFFKVIEVSLADGYNYVLSALQVGDEGKLQSFNLIKPINFFRKNIITMQL